MDMSYIIRLEQPRHRKESLSGFGGPKMLSLHKHNKESE